MPDHGDRRSSRKGVPVSPEHKEAIMRGKQLASIVKPYLVALEGKMPAGRRTNTDTINRRIADVETKLADASAIQKLILTQKKLDLQAQLEQISGASQFEELERRFIEVAKEFSDNKNISPQAWREIGVPSRVLKAAGI